MTYATELVNNYRMALRGLWNGHYWIDQRFRDSATVLSFKNATLPIYEALVHSRLEPLGNPATLVFGKGFAVVAPPGSGTIPVLMVETDEGVWRNLPGPFETPPLKLTLLDFFDWHNFHWRDFRYYLTRIEDFKGHDELAGKRALVEVLDADVMWGPE